MHAGVWESSDGPPLEPAVVVAGGLLQPCKSDWNQLKAVSQRFHHTLDTGLCGAITSSELETAAKRMGATLGARRHALRGTCLSRPVRLGRTRMITHADKWCTLDVGPS